MYQVPWPDQQQQMPPQYQSQQQNFQHPPHNFSDQSSRPQEESKGPTVRHIPIFVEGRDEPIIPKDANPASGMKRGGCQGKPDSSPRKKGPPPEEKKQQAQPQEHQQPQNQQSPTPTPPQRPDLLAIVAEVSFINCKNCFSYKRIIEQHGNQIIIMSNSHNNISESIT